MAADNAVLSQREIDALVSGGSDPAPATPDTERAAAPAPAPENARRIKPYDFRHPEKLSKEQLRGLQIIQQSVANSLAANFSARLRAPAEARLSALERGIYEEFNAQAGHDSVFVTIDMSPLEGYAVAAFGVDVAYAIIERLLGGRGSGHHRGGDRDLTDIEVALVRHIGMDVARSLVEPWARIAELEPDVTELGVGSQVLHVVPPSEFVITAWYEVRFAEQTGGISICFPLNILEQVMGDLSGHNLFDNRPARKVEQGAQVETQQLRPMKVPVRALLGESRQRASDLAALQAGDVLVLDQLVVDALRVYVGDREVFAGSPGTRGKRMALQVSAQVDDDGWVRPFAEKRPALPVMGSEEIEPSEEPLS